MGKLEEELYFRVHGIDPLSKEEVGAMLERRSFMERGEGDSEEESGRGPDEKAEGPAHQ